MIIGDKEFSNEEIYVMGILNVTPDSFSDGNKYVLLDDALKHTEKMINEGASIIDVGGESTRPGYIMISDEEEIERTAKVIERIKKEFDITVSIDTYKNKVADAAFKAGADMLNDIWGLQYDNNIAETVAKYNKAVCLMHNEKDFDISKPNDYCNSMKRVITGINKSIEIANKYGIDKNKIMIDPGIGFAKTYEMNMYVINHIDDLVKLGYPVMMAASRKSVIGIALNLPKEEREEGTISINVMSVFKGCNFIRVHDVKKNYRAVTIAKKIMSF